MKCNCENQDLWHWLQDHINLLPIDNGKTLTCSQPAKLLGQIFLHLKPSDMCPLPLITSLEPMHIRENSIVVTWTVRNQTRFGGFRFDYYSVDATQEDSAQITTTEMLTSAQRQFQIDHLKTESEYMICVTAIGDFDFDMKKVDGPIPVNNRNYQENDSKYEGYKCRKLKTLSQRHQSTSSTAHLSIIIGSTLGAVIVLATAITVTAIKFQKKKTTKREPLPQEYISYRHFSIQSSEGVYTT